MQRLRLGFTDTIPSIAEHFTTILSRAYQVERDDKNPDYLIFGDNNFGNNNLNYDPNKCVKIFYTGENQRPQNYVCHYSICFDHDYLDNRNYRYPLYIIYDHDNWKKRTYYSQNCLRMESDLSKDGFCSFVVQNPNGAKRNEIFHKLSQYKQVTSAGPWLNNTGWVLPRDDNSVQAKLAFLTKFKFNLCFENSSYPGYATEKLYEALIAKTVPIYWGSPTIGLDFNPKAFVNWHDFQDDIAFLDYIVHLDNTPQDYADMFFQPMFVDNKTPKLWSNPRFLNWFHNNVYRGVLNG